MLTREEYLQRMAEVHDWAPGWEAVTDAFEARYPGIEPRHLACALGERARWGGQEHLDGVSIYPTDDGVHLLSYGMSRLYPNEENYGLRWSAWGYELTFRLRGATTESALWALTVLTIAGNYTWTKHVPVLPGEVLLGDGGPVVAGSALTSFAIVPDTEVPGIDTVHGRVDFHQLVGLTWSEAQWVLADPEPLSERVGLGRRLTDLLAWLAQDNPALSTDVDRTVSFV